MYSHLEPRGDFPEPAPLIGGFRAQAEEWRYDADGTRYRAIVVRFPSDRVLVAIDPDQRLGRSWWVLDWRPGEVLSDEYVAEKWRVTGDNIAHVARLIRAVLGR